MNKSSGIDDGLLLRTADLAARGEFRLGEALVNPGTRTVRGPGGETDLEPRVMQVLVVLADAAGSVVTRETLFQRCWGNVYVGDDSLNRAVAGVRRIAATVAANSFALETVPRTGYQLIVNSGVDPGKKVGAGSAEWRTSRRSVMAGGAAILISCGLGFQWIRRRRSNSQLDALLADGELRLRKMEFGGETLQIFEQAVLLDPNDAKAWGGLALLRSLGANRVDMNAAHSSIHAAEEATQRALSLDARQPNAMLAMFELQGSMLDWSTRDRRLREIIEIQPDNMLALNELVALLQAAGLNKESWDWNERIIASEPLLAKPLGRRALKLWIAGRVSDADKVIEQVRSLYPGDGFIFRVQFLILSLTGRAAAARALMNEAEDRMIPGGLRSYWLTCLEALDRPTPSNLAAAKDACRAAAKADGELAAQSVMILSALGEAEAAFEIVDGFLFRRGVVVSSPNRSSAQLKMDNIWRTWIQWMFTPPVAIMRKDARFPALCVAIGLSRYWRARGVRPDYLANDR